jgi:addiction module HigA family antidote
MLFSDRIPTHPGEVILEEFLRPLGTSQLEFSSQLGIPLQRVNEIVRGKRGVTAETALLLSARLGTSPEFWLNLQGAHDLGRARGGALRERLHSLEKARAGRLARGSTTTGRRTYRLKSAAMVGRKRK